MMANEHAVPATEEDKKHGDELQHALKNSGREKKDHATNSAIPPAEDGGHNRSVAAHLHEQSHLHDNHDASRHHVQTGQLREPPQEVTRNGKGFRGK